MWPFALIISSVIEAGIAYKIGRDIGSEIGNIAKSVTKD